MKILLVDDIEDARIILATELEAAGYMVEAARDGVQALELMQHSPPDLIISDVLMPEMDGFALCRAVKGNQQLRSIPFVFYTATFVEPKDEKLAMAMGASRYIIKPLEMGKLIKVIGEVLREKEKGELVAQERLVEDEPELNRMYAESLARKLSKKVRELQRERQALQSSEEHKRLLLMSTGEAIYGLDLGGNCTFVNPAGLRMLGYRDSAQLLGENMHALIHHTRPDGSAYPVEECRICQASREGKGAHADDEILWRRQGSSFPTEYWSYPVYKDDHVVGSVVTFLDITERRQAEEELRQYELIVSNTTDMLALLDQSYMHVATNSAYLQAFGKTSVEVIGRSVAELFGEEFFSTVLKPNAERCLAGEAISYQRWFEFPASGRKYMDISYSSYRGPDNEIRGLVVTARDITVRENLQAQLVQAQKMESVGQLAGGLAHDFNNMLAVILGTAELAMEGVDPGEPIHADLMEIHKAATRSADLTQQVLAFARKQTISPRVLDLNETVEGMLKMLRRLIGEDIDLAWRPGSGLWPVKMDPSQIDQVMANLCVNAQDAISDVGKITIETRNTAFDEAYCANHPGFATGEYVLLALSDNGCGMDKEIMDRIYEPFFTTKKVGQGTGLGLAMVYGIVKQNAGFISLHSEPGQGTTFEIYLPRHAAKVTRLQQEGPTEPAKRGHETILVVEDEPAILKLTAMMLENLGYTVLSAPTPGDAIHLAETYSGEIHLLLTDVVMPEMNGRDLARTLVSVVPNLKPLFMSGYTADVIAHTRPADENLHFIQKPFLQQDLAAKVQEALASK